MRVMDSQPSWWFDRPGRPHMRNQVNGARPFSSCFRWHKITISSLVALLGLSTLQSSLLGIGRLDAGETRLVSSHCSGIGTDRLVLDAFLKPELEAHGVTSRLQHAYSVDARPNLSTFRPGKQ